MRVHYSTENNTILCGQKHEKSIKSSARFSFKLGEEGNCKNCEKILVKNQIETENKCISFQELGYKTDCQWRSGEKCNCIDNCNWKLSVNN